MKPKDAQKTISPFLSDADYKKARKSSDEAIARLVAEVSPTFYREIEKRYEKKLFAYIYRLVGNREEAEDILQNVFVKVFKNIKKFNFERKFSSWIYRIAHNEAVNHIKRKYLKKFVSLDDISSSKDKLGASSPERGPEDLWLRKESMQEVKKAMDKLPVKYKQVLIMRYFSDKSYEEIGKILKKPTNTVGTLISRAKKKLSQEITDISARRKK